VRELARPRRSMREMSLRTLRRIMSNSTGLGNEAGRVEPIALKGAVLSKLAFGDPAMRSCMDLDLLVSAARVSDVDRLMREAHYKRIAPAGLLTPRRLATTSSITNISSIPPRSAE